MPGILRPEISRATPGQSFVLNPGGISASHTDGGGGGASVLLIGKSLSVGRGFVGTQGGTSTGIVDAWTKLSTVTTLGNELAGPVMSQGWFKGAIRHTNGQIYLSCGNLGTNGGAFFFDSINGVWNRCSQDITTWWKNQGTSENYDMCYDPDLDRFYRGDGGPWTFKGKGEYAPYFQKGHAYALNAQVIPAPDDTNPNISYTLHTPYWIWLCTNAGTTDANNYPNWPAGHGGSLYVHTVDDQGYGNPLTIQSGGAVFVLVQAGNDTSPLGGNQHYEPAIDEWFTDYPNGSCVWLPTTAGDLAHWNAAGKGNICGSFDGIMEYYKGFIYNLSYLAVLTKRNVATGVVSSISTTNYPTVNGGSKFVRHYRGGMDHRNGMMWQLADAAELYVWYCGKDLSPTGWRHLTTTGNKPQTTPNANYPNDYDIGICADLHEDQNCIVAWAGYNADIQGPQTAIRQTWVLDLTTLVWRGPITTTNTPPPSTTCQTLLMYNKYRQSMSMPIGAGSVNEVWEFTTQDPSSKVYSFPLPAYSGTTYGVNYFTFPFTSNGGCKQVITGYCPLNNRFYAQGGDTQASANDGTYSMDCDTGEWRLDVGKPVYPTVPAPHAMQDGGQMSWMPSRNKFILTHVGYYAYGGVIGVGTINYSKGAWLFDPIANTYQQLNSIWQTQSYVDPAVVPNSDIAGAGSGNEWGCYYDPVTDCFFALSDTKRIYIYNVQAIIDADAAGTAYTAPYVSLTINAPVGYPTFTSVYIAHPQTTCIGRWLYFVGYSTNGVTKICRMWRWNIDTHALVECALLPPEFGPVFGLVAAMLNNSNGKVVFTFTNAPMGGVYTGGVNTPPWIYVYDPATDTWAKDNHTPTYGNFYFNTTRSIDGKWIVLAGTGGGGQPQQTHIWFYQAPTG